MTSAGGPTTVVIGADTSQAVAGLNDIIRAAALTNKEIKSLDKSIAKLTGTESEEAVALSNTLGLYSKLLGVSASYRKAVEQETVALVSNKAARKEMVASFDSMQKALSKVVSTTKEEYDGQARTLELYSRMIRLSQQAADIKLKEAAALDKVASAQARGISSTMKQEAADRKAADAAAAKAAAQTAAATAATAAAAGGGAAGAAGAGAGGAVVDTKMIAAQDRLGASYARSEAAVRSLEKAQAQADMTAEQAAMNRLTLADEEVARQQALIVVLDEQLAIQQKLAVTAMAKITGPAASTDIADINAASVANNRVTATAREAAMATNDLKNAQLAQGRAAVEVANLSNDATGKNLGGTRYALYQVAAAYGVVGAAALLFAKASVTTAESYETAFAQVQRTTGQTALALVPLHDALEQLDTVIPKSFEDLAGIATMGAQMGIPAGDLQNFTKIIAEFSATTNVATTQAATDFGKLSNLLDVPTSKFENLASSVSYLGVSSVATETQILNVSQSIAATGHNFGLTTQEILGMSSAFASLAVSPEQARSAMTRMFVNVDKAISEGGKSLDAWAASVGMTTQQFISLRNTNPDKLFNDILSSFHDVTSVGGDITGTLSNLGITSVRDIQVFERLASGFDVVTSSIQNATKAYADGTYLSESFAVVNDTVAAKAQKVADAFRNMLAGIGSNNVIQGTIKAILDGILNLLDAFNKLPVGVRAGLSTFITLIGVFAAYKASMALLTAGMLAFRQATGNGLNASTIGLRTFLREAQLAFGGAAKSADQFALASAAAGRAAAGSAPGIAAQTAALGANAAASTAASVAKGAGAASGAASVAGTVATGVGGIAAGVAKSFGPVLVISSVISLVAGLVSAFHQQDQAAVTAAENLQKYGAALLDAGGGAQSLIDAMNKDEAAFNSAGQATNKMDGYFGKVVEHFGDVDNGVSKVTRTFYDMNGVATDLGSKFVAVGKSQDDYTASQSGVQGAVKKTNQTLKDQVTVLGANSEAWLQNAISNEIVGDNSPFKPEDLSNLLTLFKAHGLSLGQAIADGVTKGAGKLNEDVAPVLADLQRSMDVAAGEIKAKYAALIAASKVPATRVSLGLQSEADVIASNKTYQAQIDSIHNLIDVVTGSTTALGGLADKQALLNQIAAAFPPIADTISASGTDMQNVLAAGGAAAQTLSDQLNAASDAFSQMLGMMSSTVDQTLAVENAWADLAKGVSDNGPDFSQVTENGRKNLANLMTLFDAAGTQMATSLKNGQITAQEAALQMAQYSADIVKQLAAVGVPTDQIDFLVNYMNAVTQHKWGVKIDADITAAIQGISAVKDFLTAVGNYSVIVYQGVANIIDTSTAAGVEAASKGIVANTSPTYAGPAYTGPTTFGGGASPADIFDMSKAEEDAANAAKAAAAAQKDASKSSKDAAKTATDAAKAAKDAADAQTRYLQAAGAYFGSFAKNAFSLQDEIGNTVESLQKLGESIAENGTAFNEVTQAGRANFTALESVFTNFGAVIQTQVTNGSLTAAQGLAQMKQMAAGVYSELISLGVPAADIDAFFKAMGYDTSGWSHASAAVKAYAGFITAAYDATGQFMKQTDQTADYVKRLTDALDTQATAYWGLQDAQDAVATQFNQMKKAQDDNAASVADLIAKNKELNATIGDQTVIANKAYTEYLIAKKYGETGRAADYLQQYQDAKGQITTAQGQVKTNTAQIATLKASKNLLTGNSQAAIDNRKSLQDLTNTYTTQIEAYAAAGHTQAQVAAYAKTLKEQFDSQAQSLGYTRAQLKPYNTELDDIVTAIGKVPTTITTTATADTSAASAALGAIPTGGTYTIKTQVDAATTKTTKQELKNIPNKADYKVTATANTTPATTSLGKIPKTGTFTISPKVNPLSQSLEQIFAKSLPKTFNLNAVLAIRNQEMDAMWTNLQAQIAA